MKGRLCITAKGHLVARDPETSGLALCLPPFEGLEQGALLLSDQEPWICAHGTPGTQGTPNGVLPYFAGYACVFLHVTNLTSRDL